jgi:hypothetical protein
MLLYDIGAGTASRPQLGDLAAIAVATDVVVFSWAPKGRAIESVLALKDDKVMTADTTGTGALPGPHPFAELSKRKELARIQTADGVATLWVAPTATEGRCTWLQFRNEEIPVVPCLPKGYETRRRWVFGVHTIAGHVILAGECGLRRNRVPAS